MRLAVNDIHQQREHETHLVRRRYNRNPPFICYLPRFRNIRAHCTASSGVFQIDRGVGFRFPPRRQPNHGRGYDL